MRRSIFGNLVLCSFAVIAVAAVIATVYFATFLESFAISEKSKALKENIDVLERATYFALTNQSASTDVMFQNLIDNMSEYTQSEVTVFDSNGFVIATSNEEIDSSLFVKVNTKVTVPVLSGESIESVRIFNEPNGEKNLTIAVPLVREDEVYGGVMFNQLVPEIKSMYEYVSNRMLIIIMIAMLMTAALFYALSVRITYPVRKISAAVTEFTKGNFKKRVEYNSDNELGELAHNINEMASSLEDLENLRNSFVSDVSHELRTPLTTISGFVEGIIDGTIPEESRNEYLDVVLSESKRLSRLITNLLQLSRMDSGQTKLEKVDFDINEMIRLTLLKFEMMITPKNIEVSLNIDDERVMVNADKDSISQVLINLINNAVKFTPDGGTMSINVDSVKDKIFVSVTNSGHGIEPEQLSHIWDRFYKSDKSRSKDRTGVGLGLYIVKRIIGMHNETIKVESVVDDYTKFTFTLAKAKHTEVVENKV